MLHPAYRAVLMRLSFALFLFPGSALAEVSDKEPSIDQFWAVGIMAALLCLFGTRIKPRLGIVFFAPVALWFMSLFLELHSADVGPSLLREQGTIYYWPAYVAFGAVLCGLVIGYVWHKRAAS